MEYELEFTKTDEKFLAFALYACCERHIRVEFAGAILGQGFDLFVAKESIFARSLVYTRGLSFCLGTPL
jgi:hypothetical protein